MSILAFAEAAEPQVISNEDDEPANRSSSPKNLPYLYTFTQETNLLRQARAGDQAAKETLILAERPTIRRLANNYAYRLNQRLDVDEIEQRTYLKLLEMNFANSFPRQTSSRFRYFVETMMKNMVLDITRRHKAKPEISYDVPLSAEGIRHAHIETISSPLPGPEDLVTQKEQVAAILERIYGLPGRQRDTFDVRFMGASTSEAAQLLKISEGSVKTHMARSLANITLEVLPGFHTLSRTFMKAAHLSADEKKHRDCIEEVRRTAIRDLSDMDAFIFSCIYLVPKHERVAISDLAETLNLSVTKTRERLTIARRIVLFNMDPKHRAHPFAEKIAVDNQGETKIVKDERREFLLSALTKALLVLELRHHIITDDEITRQNFPEWTSVQKRLADDYDGLKIEDLVLTWIKDQMMAYHDVHGRFPKKEKTGIPDYPAIKWSHADDALCDYYDECEEQKEICAALQSQLVPC